MGLRESYALFSGIQPAADPMGPHFVLFSEIRVWRTDPKVFVRAPLAPMYANFEGERAPKKRTFFQKVPRKSQNFPISAYKTPSLACFFQNFACGAQNFLKIMWFARAQKINKVSEKFFKNLSRSRKS